MSKKITRLKLVIVRVERILNARVRTALESVILKEGYALHVAIFKAGTAYILFEKEGNNV